MMRSTSILSLLVLLTARASAQPSAEAQDSVSSFDDTHMRREHGSIEVGVHGTTPKSGGSLQRAMGHGHRNSTAASGVSLIRRHPVATIAGAATAPSLGNASLASQNPPGAMMEPPTTDSSETVIQEIVEDPIAQWTITPNQHCGGVGTCLGGKDGSNCQYERGWAVPSSVGNANAKKQKCMDLCDAYPNCKAFIYRTDGKCFWQRTVAPYSANSQHICYDKKISPTAYSETEGKKCSGTTLSTISASGVTGSPWADEVVLGTKNECAKVCSTSVECKGFSFGIAEGKCYWLKGTVAAESSASVGFDCLVKLV